jgi:hypothetical protein
MWRRRSRFVKYCNLYMPRDGDVALIAATYNHGGLFAEKPDAVEICDSGSAGELGQAIVKQLHGCEYRRKFDYAPSRPSDWPAFQRSGEKTIKAFTHAYVCYGVRGANDVNIVWQFESPELDNGVSLHMAISASAADGDVGALAQNLHAFFLRTEGLAKS